MGGRVGGRRSSIPLLVAFFLGAASPALAGGTIDQVGGGERGDTTMVGRDTIVDLDPLVVSVTQLDILRSRLPNSVSVVSRMRLEESGTLSALAAVSEEVPGVFVTQRGLLGYGVGQGAAGVLSIRGVGGEPNTQVLIMTDGRPQMMGLMGHPIPDLHLSHGVERVEVIKGPASVLYGSGALGGVVNLITRRDWDPGLEVEGAVSYGSFGTRRLEGGLEYGLGSRAGIAVSGGSFRTDGHRPWSSFGLDNVGVRGSVALGEGLLLRGDFSISDLDTYDPGTVAEPLEDNWVDIVRGGTGLSLENRGERVSGAARVFLNFGRHRIYDGFYSKDQTLGFNLHQGITLGEGGALTLGLDGARYGGEAENRETGFSWGDNHTSEFGLFGVVHLPLGERLFGTGGLRLNRHSLYGAELAPQLGLSFHLWEGTTLRAQTARGFRSPTIRELYLFPAPTPDLGPERGWNHEVGLLQSLGGIATLELALFQFEGSDLIRVAGAPPNLVLENSGQFKHRGGEVAFQVSAPLGFDLDLSYGYLDPGEMTRAHPGHQLAGGLRYQNGPVRARLGAEYVGRHYGADGALDRLDDYLVVDGRVTIELLEHYSLYLAIDNLFDREYEIMSGYPMPSRALSVGIRGRR